MYTLSEVLALHAYQDSSMRLFVYIYSFSLAILAFGKHVRHHLLMILSACAIGLALAYALFVVIYVYRELRYHPRYSRVNSYFYFTEIFIFFAISVVVFMGSWQWPN